MPKRVQPNKTAAVADTSSASHADKLIALTFLTIQPRPSTSYSSEKGPLIPLPVWPISFEPDGVKASLLCRRLASYAQDTGASLDMKTTLA